MKRNNKWKCMLPIVLLFLAGCSTSAQVSNSAKKILLDDPAVATGHIGICIYEPATQQYWYGYNDTKNFIPGSNTKLFTLYAGMKYLGDSLVGLKYCTTPISLTSDYDKLKTLLIMPTGDPTLLHPDFKNQPVFDSLKSFSKQYNYFGVEDKIWKEQALGAGWSWNDYMDDYMTERSSFPVYGNTIKIKKVRFDADSARVDDYNNSDPHHKMLQPFYYFTAIPTYFEPLLNRQMDTSTNAKFSLKRDIGSNEFSVVPSNDLFVESTVPFFTTSKKGSFYSLSKHSTASQVLADELNWGELAFDGTFTCSSNKFSQWRTIKSQPTDSLFTPMMHRSDNFFAEQTLLMVSNEKLGYMSDEAIIDTLLKTDLKDIPQKPRWVDGSGLSRYNLFTPRSMVYILDKLRTEFGMERLKNILATGGTGTLSAYYKKDSGYIFAKTGTLTNNCALSGYLYTKTGKLLLFSVLANNYQSPAMPVRRAVERFLQGIREKN